MANLENYLLSAFFFFILCTLFYWWKLKKQKKEMSAQEKFTLQTLELAHSQYETFNIKLHATGVARSGVSAMLRQIDKDGLHMEANDYVSEDWNGRDIEVFFRARREEGPVFYVFSSKIKRVRIGLEHSDVLMAMPRHLRVEKKRFFMRVKPQKEEVRVIGVWKIQPGKHLPHAADEVGAPITHYRQGAQGEAVQVEDVSASGMALRFALDKDGRTAPEFAKGTQLLCLVVYVLDDKDDKPIAFWCTGEVMNSRIAEGPHPALVIGLEFTNWAILEQGTNEIHWAHSSPSRGARPIQQWVERIDARQKPKA